MNLQAMMLFQNTTARCVEELRNLGETNNSMPIFPSTVPSLDSPTPNKTRNNSFCKVQGLNSSHLRGEKENCIVHESGNNFTIDKFELN